MYTQGHTVMHALRAGGLRPIRDGDEEGAADCINKVDMW